MVIILKYIMKLVRFIDSVSEWTVSVGSWITLALVLVVTYGVITRYFFDRPLLWTHEVALMFGFFIYAQGFYYAQKYDANIKVDLIYDVLPKRTKAFIDVLGTLIILFPLIILLIETGWEWMVRSISTDERMPYTGWFPPAWPLRTVLVLSFLLFFFQSFANFIRNLYYLIMNKPLETVKE